MHSRLLYLWVALAVFVAHMAVTGGHLLSPDGELMFRTAESIALRGELSIMPIEYSEELGQLVVPRSRTFATVPGPDGKFYAQYLPLQSVLSVPLVWLGRATQSIFAESFYATLPTQYRMQDPNVGRAWRRAVVVALFNPLVMALTALVIMRLGSFLSDGKHRAGMWAAMLWAFGTMAWPHSRSYFTEPLAGLFAMIALDQLLRWYVTPLNESSAHNRLRQMTVLGLALAAAIWTRMDSPAIAFGIGVTLVLAGEWKRRRESAYGLSAGQFPWRDYLLSGALVVGSYALLLAFNNWRFGDAGGVTGGYSDQAESVKFSTPVFVGLHGFLMTPGKSIFFFSPVLILAIWGWILTPAQKRWSGWIVLGSFLPFALAMVKWQNWSGGWDWGPRHVFQLHAPLVLGAVYLFREPMPMLRSAAVKVLFAVGIVVQLYGSSQSPFEFYQEFYRSSADGVYFTVAYRPDELPTVQSDFRVQRRAADNPTRILTTTPAALPAPLADSVYMPSHTVWAGYAAMLKEGRCDIWLLARILPEGQDVPALDESSGVQP
ncbi:hypothetical protein KQI84_19075 [bacterium]|nr:hypothetical protein [bacterium]